MTHLEAFNLAITNVASFGDTDIFPSPLDRFVCQDAPDAFVAILQEIDRTFDQYLATLLRPLSVAAYGPRRAKYEDFLEEGAPLRSPAPT